MKHLYFLTICCLLAICQSNVFSQDIDSVQKLINSQQFHEALEQANTVDRLFKKKDKSSKKYAQLLMLKADAHKELCQFDQAITLYKKSIDLLEKNRYSNISDIFLCKINLFDIYIASEDIIPASEFLTSAFDDISMIFDIENDRDILDSYSKFEGVEDIFYSGNKYFCWLDFLTLEYEKSLKDAFKHFEYIKETFPNDYMKSVDSYSMIGMILEKMNRIEEANTYYNDALSILDDKDEKESILYASLLRKCGGIFMKLGNYNKAYTLFNEAKCLIEKINRCYHAEYAAVLEHIGLLYIYQNNGELALQMFKEAAALNSKIFGEKSLLHERSQIGIMEAYTILGDFEKADNLSAMLFTGESAGSVADFTRYVISSALYCMHYHYYTDAAEMLNMALNTIMTNGETEYKYLRETLHLLIQASVKTKDITNAIQKSRELLLKERETAHDLFVFLSEAERAVYWKESNEYLNTIFSISTLPKETENPSPILYDASLLKKGLLLEAGINLNDLIFSSNDPVIIDKFKNYQSLKRQLSTFNSDQYTQNAATIENLRTQIDQTEKQLLKESKQYGDFMQFINLNWKDVQKKLAADEVAIEFIITQKDSTDYYYAEILKRDWEEPCHQYLFATHKNLVHEVSDTATYNTQVHYKKIWNKLRRFTKDCSTIYFAPVGDLYNIGIEYALLPDGKRMNEVYNMVRLSSTRELVHERSRSATAESAALFGGLNYNLSEEEMEVYSSIYGERGNDSHSSTDDLHNNAWGYLQGTREEVRQIDNILSKMGVSTSMYCGDEGIEESFKSLSETPLDIIHIATHGFYLPPKQESTDSDPARFRFISEEEQTLLRSGLVFSGANNAWLNRTSSSEDMDDGILTSREISHLNFKDVDMVVLSACQTGLGDVSGEGVFGLQRGFKKAGVQTLVMSLWEVSDEATQVMMTAFYNELSKGKSKRDAFQNAQNEVKKRHFIIDGVKRSGSEPFFWASFIMVD